MSRNASDQRQRVLGAFRAFARRLSGCGHGTAPDWLNAGAVNALWLELPGSGAHRLHVAVRDGVPLRSLPAQWQLPGLGEALPLERVRAPRAHAQLAPALRPSSRPAMVGTATALLRANEGGQSYLLTCAHVATPTLEGGFGAMVDITHSSVVGQARLTDWRPAPSAGPEHSTMDAALLSVDEPLVRALRGEGGLLPSGIAEGPRAGQKVSLRSHRATLAGELKVYWSGAVDVPGLSPGQTDYFLDEAIGYCCDSQGGDSGGAIWDDQSRLMGMHIAGIDGVGAGEANAVYGPIRPVLDTFGVSPWLRSGGVAALDAARVATGASRPTRSGSAPSVNGTSLSERDIVACTLWGEARNQGDEGLRAVACVIANRWLCKYRHCTSAHAVCLDPWQFSCWLKNDPNQPRMLAVARQPDAVFLRAQALADELLQRTLADITRGARHYYAVTMRQAPSWARGKNPCVVIGDHLFFNDVA